MTKNKDIRVGSRKQKWTTPFVVKPKWWGKIEQKHQVKIEIHFFDKITHDIDKSFQKLLVSMLINYLTHKIRGSKMLEWLQGYKTYIVIALTALFNVGIGLGWWTPETDWIVILNSILVSFGAGFIKAGLNREAKKSN